MLKTWYICCYYFSSKCVSAGRFHICRTLWINIFWMFWLFPVLSAPIYVRKRCRPSILTLIKQRHTQICDEYVSLATQKNWKGSSGGLKEAGFFTLPMCMWGPAEAELTEEWQSAGPGCWEDHMPLSTPAGCVGGGLASPRIGPESLSPGSQAGLNMTDKTLPEKRLNCHLNVKFYFN